MEEYNIWMAEMLEDKFGTVKTLEQVAKQLTVRYLLHIADYVENNHFANCTCVQKLLT